jgi:hypothetical protein
VRIVIEGVFPASTLPPAPSGSTGKVIYTAPATPAPAVDRREDIRSQLFAMVPSLEAMRDWKGPSDAELANLIAAADQLSTGARAMRVTGSDRCRVGRRDAARGGAGRRHTAGAGERYRGRGWRVVVT